MDTDTGEVTALLEAVIDAAERIRLANGQHASARVEARELWLRAVPTWRRLAEHLDTRLIPEKDSRHGHRYAR